MITPRRLRWAGHVVRMEILTSKPTGKRPLGREDSIRMDLKEVGISTKNWVDSTQDRDYWRDLGNVALNLQVPEAMELVS